MVAIKRMRLAPLPVGAAILATLLVAACGGGGEPENLVIPVTVEHEKLEPETLKVKHNDMVTLRIETDEPGEFHLHGYDIREDVVPGETTDFVFEASAEGRFKIAFHPTSGSDDEEAEEHGDEDHEEGEEEIDIGTLEVRPR